MDVPEGERGLFFEEECYICDVLLEKVRQHFIIFWIGKESSNVKRTQTAYHAAQLDHSAKIDATQVRLFQGDEIDEFRGLLPRGFVLVEGAGGWRVPVRGRQTLADLAMELRCDVILVVVIDRLAWS